MRKPELSFRKMEGGKDRLSIVELTRGSADWLFDGEYLQHSKNTLAIRRIVTDKLL